MHVLYQDLLGHHLDQSPHPFARSSAKLAPGLYMCWSLFLEQPSPPILALAAHFFCDSAPSLRRTYPYQISAPFSLCKLDLLLFINYFCLSTYLPECKFFTDRDMAWVPAAFPAPKENPLRFTCRTLWVLRTAVKCLTYLSNAMWQFFKCCTNTNSSHPHSSLFRLILLLAQEMEPQKWYFLTSTAHKRWLAGFEPRQHPACLFVIAAHQDQTFNREAGVGSEG